jgi:hypothetical protein
MLFKSSFLVHAVASTFPKFLQGTNFSAEQPNLLQRCKCPLIPTGFTVLFSTTTPVWKRHFIQTGDKGLFSTTTSDWKWSFMQTGDKVLFSTNTTD